jgi:hypothetical protein
MLLQGINTVSGSSTLSQRHLSLAAVVENLESLSLEKKRISEERIQQVFTDLNQVLASPDFNKIFEVWRQSLPEAEVSAKITFIFSDCYQLVKDKKNDRRSKKDLSHNPIGLNLGSLEYLIRKLWCQSIFYSRS